MSNKIKKEFYPDYMDKNYNICILSVPGNSPPTAATLTELFNEARKDFPGFDENQAVIIMCGNKPENQRVSTKSIIFQEGHLHTAAVKFNGIQLRTRQKPPASYKSLGPPIGLQG